MWIAEIAHQMSLIPLIWLVVLTIHGKVCDLAWWWIAVAFSVSWFADTIAHVVPQSHNAWIGIVYPVSQTAIIGAVLLRHRRQKVALLGVLLGASTVAILWCGVEDPDLVLRSVAWLAVVAIMWAEKALPFRLRLCLVIYFGFGLVTWLIHLRWLIVPTWYPYQIVRLIGLLVFCWAALKPSPSLRLARAA